MKQTMRRYGWLLALLFLALGAAGLWTVSTTHDISLTANEIQSRIDGALPREIALKGPAQALVPSVIAKSATVDLKDGKVALAVALEGRLRNGKSFEIEAKARGVPKYDDGALYFEPEKVDISRLAYEGQSASELVGRLAGKLGDGKLRDALEAKAQKLDDWAEKAADAAIRKLLEERPVYRLRDDMNGAVMKAALEKIAVEGDRLNVTFSLWRLTTAAVGGLVSLLLGVILALLVIRILLNEEDFDISAC
jgi:hypothetical protein